jgi:tetratricopeptide (TPR) repeat protein
MKKTKMKTIALLTLLNLIIFHGFSQQLSDVEKENIRKNIKDLPNDSLLMTAKRLIMASSFYELSEGAKRNNEIKSINTALEILKLIEYKNLKNDDYYDWRASGYKMLNNNEQAIIYYSKAIDLNPKKLRYFEKRAECKMAINNHYGAIPDITKALTLNPNDDSLLGNRAMCYVQTDQWNNAMVDITKAISLNKKVGFYFITRGVIHSNFNRKKEACLDFNTAGDLGDERAFEFLREYCTNK